MKFICYPKCSTCKKARIFLTNHQIHFIERNIKEENPTVEEIKEWKDRADVPLRRFFNTSGMLYRQLHLKDKLDDMSEDEMIELLASDGMMVKRPVLVTDEFVLLGFKEKQWEEKLTT